MNKIKKKWMVENNKVECVQSIKGIKVIINDQLHSILKLPSPFSAVSPQRDYTITSEDLCFTLALRSGQLDLVRDEVCTDSGQPWIPAQEALPYIKVLTLCMFCIVMVDFFWFSYSSGYHPGALGGALAGLAIIGLIHPGRIWLDKFAGRNIPEPRKMLLCMGVAFAGALVAMLFLRMILWIIFL